MFKYNAIFLVNARYKIEIKTADVSAAGTESKVFYRFLGDLGASPETKVNSNKNWFERGE